MAMPFTITFPGLLFPVAAFALTSVLAGISFFLPDFGG
jgi:hypothetical protein